MPIVKFYEAEGKVISISAVDSVEVVYAKVQERMNQLLVTLGTSPK